ncbi:hypothetical protein BZA70DRAFT_275169 [Myxozyma melibiosi]|uniref:Matrin-type domain-containing protein n=1 Tax=Myxozyma melibiosi TaxID=54550 RepID=A0ABR1FAI5_9ASCO
MDYQNRAGSKKGGGGVAGFSETNADRRERLRKLALETIDIEKDPYFFKNHLGSFECKLCLSIHLSDGSYLAHTQGRKHQTNLARRAARDQREGRTDTLLLTNGTSETAGVGASSIQVKKNLVKIGRPGYRITKIRDPVTRQQGLRFQLQYPEITTEIKPRHRFMSAFEQLVENANDNKRFQYLLVAAEPYETVAFKIPNKEIDRRPGKFWTHYDQDTNEYFLQLVFKVENNDRYNGVPGLR